MKRKLTLLTILVSPLLFFSSSLLALNTIGQDTCTVNDFCPTAIPIENVIADEDMVCIEGCNLNATPELFNNECQIGVFPTVWYSVYTDGGTLMNIQVSSLDIDKPTLTVFHVITDCNDLEIVPLGGANHPCIIGSNGTAEALGTDISSNSFYLIAVSSFDTTAGTFTLCVNTISTVSQCVTDSDLKIVARSTPAELSSPLKPGETVRICMNVNSFSAANNGCQWFQGLVPVFGNGWDPSSFNASDMHPLNATINGNLIGEQNNGVYSTATWDWFLDVDYHFNNPSHQIGDFDGNGTYELCSSLYDPDCPDLGGLVEGCCGPCWNTHLGTILPGGWFAYGVNGSCPTPGPPIRVDWGDGNTCGGGMGPWSFCFDLVVRDYPECMQDSTTSDLSIGFFTFSDGEVGAWSGAASICALDQPVMVTFPMVCGAQTDLGIEFAEDKCANDVFDYILNEPGIENWTWAIFPSSAVKQSPKSGEDGYVIQDTLINQTQDPIEVTYYFTGYVEGSSGTVIKQVRFRIIPGIRSSLPDVIYACEKDKDSLVISTLPLFGGLAPFQYLWSPGGQTTSSITLLSPFQSSSYRVQIVDSIGCTYQREIIFKVHPCHLDTIMTDDESNDMHTEEDAPIGGGKIAPPVIDAVSPANISTDKLKIFPLPASDFINIEWPKDVHDATTLMVLDPRGYQMYQAEVSKIEIDKHRMQINVSGYADGVYIVILQTKQFYLTGKVVKM